MRAVATLVASVVVSAVLVGCTPVERACTLIAAPRGVSVTVDPALAGLDSLDLTVCSAGTCVRKPVQLAPGDDATAVGFAEIEKLAVGPVQVSATAVVSGGTRRYRAITTTAALVYPNGPDCGSGGPQASVRLGRDGLR